ncbi:hypothetical protein NDR87_26165 [Nocardia sp. CDC159]|uniref:Uncharacterized protein n=1 Tax=Nocardia pulmonis TaxID=2951408 RepID=A0A9X2E6C1_9NOCA|nr:MULTISPECIES: hypothetical protein [Nocardia]MCM6774932.1 hypothetical protein [Nocardia pulmonis]MCM6789863.1 hypothetical protein [Nocardia sp. CDC159]
MATALAWILTGIWVGCAVVAPWAACVAATHRNEARELAHRTARHNAEVRRNLAEIRVLAREMRCLAAECGTLIGSAGQPPSRTRTFASDTGLVRPQASGADAFAGTAAVTAARNAAKPGRHRRAESETTVVRPAQCAVVRPPSDSHATDPDGISVVEPKTGHPSDTLCAGSGSGSGGGGSDLAGGDCGGPGGGD